MITQGGVYPSGSSLTNGEQDEPNLFVSEGDWAAWERDRERANRRYARRQTHERAKPPQVHRSDLQAQLHALREHNVQLLESLSALQTTCDTQRMMLNLLARRAANEM